MLRHLFFAAIATGARGATLEYHNGQYDIGCGNGMYLVDAGCGMDAKVEGILQGTYAAGCDLCMRILEQDGWYEGCEGTARCVESKTFLGRSNGIWLKALPAPSPPSPPALPPPDAPPPPSAPYDWMDSVCPEDMDPEVCQKRLLLGGAGGVALVTVAVVAARSASGASQLL